jgi:hypothetical protein
MKKTLRRSFRGIGPILALVLCLMLAACGKKEWPQPVMGDELIRINHLEARMDSDCLLISAKLGGRLINLEYFMVEVEQNGCPTCPFMPTFSRRLYPNSEGVTRRENSFLFTICTPLPAETLRIRVTADSLHRIVEPAVSEVITLSLQPGES